MMGYIYAIAIAAISAFTGGFMLCHSMSNKAYLEARVQGLEKSLKQYESVIGVVNAIDDETSSIERTNQEIEDALLRKARELAGDNDPVCLDTDWLRDLKRLQ